MTIRTLFPTRLYAARLPDDGWLEALEEACWMVEDGDAAGHAWCEEKGYPGYTSYASLDDLPTRATAFESLAELLEEHAWTFAQALHWDLDRDQLSLDAIWVNMNEEHDMFANSGGYFRCPCGALLVVVHNRLGVPWKWLVQSKTSVGPRGSTGPCASPVFLCRSLHFVRKGLWLRNFYMPTQQTLVFFVGRDFWNDSVVWGSADFGL